MWMNEQNGKVLWLAILVIAAFWDFKERRIQIWLMIVGALIGICGGIAMKQGPETGNGWYHLGLNVGKSAGVGLVLLSLARLTGGAIGTGDGLFFLMSAWFWNWGQLVWLFLAALGISSVWGMVLFMKRQWSGRLGSHGFSDTIPFLTCCLIPGIWLVVYEIGMKK